ncbi:MAG: GIY-YIG nuclease family protein [Candidatus Acidiferrum sp.]
MAFVYILQSETTHRYYVGSTNDLVRRLEEHGRGHTLSTRERGPWTLVYQEQCESLLEARRRELEIKRWKSSKMIQALIKSSVG